jgi:acyl-CoA reductase-like NAD-dependent aldehyde dehydrogenase
MNTPENVPHLTLESLDPATGEVVGHVAVTPVGEISVVVDRARAAQPAWAGLGPEERARRLVATGPRLLEEADRIARLMTREMGKPLAESTAEVTGIASGVEDELAEIVEALTPDRVQGGGLCSVVHHDPLGVCAAITPWNFPVSMPHWMVLPALAAGNTVVFKPSEETPLCGQAYADILRASLPEDVLQVVHGADEQGKALVRADVDLIAFTGSREAGKHILRSASDGLKRVILELGGKDPLLVLSDADLDSAADFAVWNGFRNAGQVCISTERIFVHDSVADAFEALLVERVRNLVTGPGLDPSTSVGPMVNAQQRAHVLRQLEEAVDRGATVLVGGGEHPERFVSPTVLSGVRPDMTVARDETFGPVVCLTRVESDAEAVALANDTPFGLGAVVFGSPERASRVARRLTAGMIGINGSSRGAPGTPWVGARESGFGFHKSREGHRQFTQARVVTRPA